VTCSGETVRRTRIRQETGKLLVMLIFVLPPHFDLGQHLPKEGICGLAGEGLSQVFASFEP
jgi:hypothetical protein